MFTFILSCGFRSIPQCSSPSVPAVFGSFSKTVSVGVLVPAENVSYKKKFEKQRKQEGGGGCVMLLQFQSITSSDESVF
jgi:hypothetical protein